MTLDPSVEESLALLSRQYFQLLDPDALRWLEGKILKQPDVQAWLYAHLFDQQTLRYPPPERYQMRALKLLVAKIEEALDDPEEDELSDDLVSLLSSFLSSNLPSEAAVAQQKAYVTYNFSRIDASITLLESRSVISSSGTTGLRTWEAALHLGSYLASSREIVAGKNMLELGAGTGILSVLCAKGLGVNRIMATDGDEGVVDALKSNIFLNGLEGSRKIEASVLRWGRTIRTTAFEEDFDDDPYDIVLGADITYDKTVVPWLASTLRELFDLRPSLEAFISATIRNEDTFNAFVRACRRNHLDVTDVEFEPVPIHRQNGPFYPVETPIRIVHITSKGFYDSFAV